MGMSDCDVCWETPCSCGWGYIGWSVDRINKGKEMMDMVLAFKEAYPHVEVTYSTSPKSEEYKIWSEFTYNYHLKNSSN